MSEPQVKTLTKEDLAAENAALKQQLAAVEQDKAQASADEALIAAKVKAGLSRPQAEQVVKDQRAHDAWLKEAEAKRTAKRS